jgi:hypothetical protein
LGTGFNRNDFSQVIPASLTRLSAAGRHNHITGSSLFYFCFHF